MGIKETYRLELPTGIYKLKDLLSLAKIQERGRGQHRPSGEIHSNPYQKQWQAQSAAAANEAQGFPNHPSFALGSPTGIE